MKFTFNTFFIDGKSIGSDFGFTLSDREILSNSGVVVFTLYENSQFRTISGRIFIESRGFVYGHEMMKVHKELIKKIRKIYEMTVGEYPMIERKELIKIMKQRLSESCAELTGRTPVIVPIFLDANENF